MGFRLDYRTVASTTQALWTPSVGPVAGSVLLAGRPPGDWQIGVLSDLPRQLVDEGRQVVAAEFPNWGNSASVALVDSMLAGLPASRLLVIGSGRGALTALNWAVRHDSQVAGIALINPIVDLTEHFNRVTGDQASINAAYGGGFLAVANAWDPAFKHRRAMLADMLAGRLHIWYDLSNPTTPTSVTETIGAKLRATMHVGTTDLVTVAKTLVGEDTGWDQQAAAAEKRAWVGVVESNPAVLGWHRSGDGHQSIVMPSGERWHFYADTRTGTVDATTGRFTSGHLVRNSLVRRDSNNAFVGQVWGGTGTPANVDAVVPDQGLYPGNFYWPISGAAIENGQLQVLASMLTGVATSKGDHVLTLDPVTGARTGAVDFTDPFGWRPRDLVEHGGYFYVYREHQLQGGGASVSRVAVGQLTSPALWQRWNGDGWTATVGPHVPMLTTGGADLPTFLVDYAYRASRYGFLAVGKEVFSPRLVVYRSDWPQGPWRQVGVVNVDVKISGERLGGDDTWSYIPSWHPQLDTADGLMVSFATGYPTQPLPITDLDYWYELTQFAVVPRQMFVRQ